MIIVKNKPKSALMNAFPGTNTHFDSYLRPVFVLVRHFIRRIESIFLIKTI